MLLGFVSRWNIIRCNEFLWLLYDYEYVNMWIYIYDSETWMREGALREVVEEEEKVE